MRVPGRIAGSGVHVLRFLVPAFHRLLQLGPDRLPVDHHVPPTGLRTVHGGKSLTTGGKMSLYNMLFGVNELAGILLKIIGMNPNDIPRFRDCFISNGEIVIYTRTGGGNRDEYELENDRLADNENYLRNEDDSYDCTYANFYYKFPDEYAADLNAIEERVTTYTPSEKFRLLFESMDAKKT
jgi:hypothetical protein